MIEATSACLLVCLDFTKSRIQSGPTVGIRKQGPEDKFEWSLKHAGDLVTNAGIRGDINILSRSN
jgi:hypothetical protein